MPTEWLQLVNDYEAQVDAAPPGDLIPYPADEIDRLHNAVDSQVRLTIENTPIGVLWNPDRTSLQVAAGIGLNVTVQPGRSKNLHSTYGPAQIELTGELILGELAPNTTKYIWTGIDVTVDNDTRATGQPYFPITNTNVLDGGVPLAMVVVGATSITSVTDLRVPVRFQDVDIHGQDVLTSLDAADELLVYDASTGQTKRITKANLDSLGSSSASITSNQNNYSTGDYSVLRLTSDASRNITGLVAVDNKVLTIVNVGSNNIVLQHQNASSTAANRIIIPGAADLTLQANYAATIWYDATTDRWRVWHTWATGGGGGGSDLTLSNNEVDADITTVSKITIPEARLTGTSSDAVFETRLLIPVADVNDSTLRDAALAPYLPLPDLIKVIFVDELDPAPSPPFRVVNADTTMTQADQRIGMDSASAHEITLPDAEESFNRRFVVMNFGVGILTVSTQGADTFIGNGSTVDIAEGETLEALGVRRYDNSYHFQRS